MLSSFAHTQFGSDVGVKWEPPGHCTQFKRQPQLAVCAEFHSFEIAKKDPRNEDRGDFGALSIIRLNNFREQANPAVLVQCTATTEREL